MAHFISAALLKGDFDTKIAATFDLQAVPLGFDITLFWLDIRYTEYWGDKLCILGTLKTPLRVNKSELLFPDDRVIVHLMSHITGTTSPLYAIIATEYFGGIGEQAAALYRGETLITDDEQASDYGSINQVLRGLGVDSQENMDEFDTLGLSNYRRIPSNFLDIVENYPDKNID